MSQIHFPQLFERLHSHHAALARLALCPPDEAAAAAVALLSAALGYGAVVLTQLAPSPDGTLFASTGITAEQQRRWHSLDRRGARFWRRLQAPAVLPIDLLPAEEAALLAGLGLSDTVLVAPLTTTRPDAPPDSLLITAGPLAEHDAAVDLGLLELLAIQIGSALASSAYQRRLEREVAARAETERALRERLAQLGVVDQLAAAVCRIDAAGRLTLLNQTWATLTGFTVAESIGAYLWQYLHPDDWSAAQQLFGSVIDGCTALGREQLRLVTSDGRLRWVELSLTPLVYPAQPCGAAGLLLDVSERRQQEQVEAARRGLLEALATGESLPAVCAPLVQMLGLHYPDGLGLALICDETGLIQRQGVREMQPSTYSYTSAAGLEGPIDARLSFDDRAPLVLAGRLDDDRWRPYRQLAHEHGLRACWAQPLYDRHGTLLGALAIGFQQPRTPAEAELEPLAAVAELAATAIERVRDEVALRDREELFGLISENTTDHIGVLDEEGKYLYASPSLRASLGYNPADLVGISAFAHVHPDDLALTLASWNKVDDQGLVQTTFRYRTTHGTWRWFDAIGNAVSYRGARAFISVSRDITERRQAEQARQRLEAQLAQAQKMESIGTLAGGIAHDFNNILTAILGNVQLALLGLTPDSAEYPLLEEIEKAATRAATLTRQLLTFSRYQQHERKAVDLNATISDLLQMFRRLIGGSVEIAIELAPDLPLLVADPVQIEQVVLNLAVNARDAMPNGGELLIATRSSLLDETDCHDYPWARPGRYVQIIVCDTGVGMNAETQQRIFEPFFTTKAPGKGTGLGLAVVYGIIKQYDGFITVSSTVGKGSIFTVFLPAQTAAGEPSEPLTLPHARGGNETILVVEDEPSLRQLAQTLLERLGYTVLCAEDGLAAVELFSANPEQIDLVMLDLIMPRLGGRDALSRIRAIRPDVPAFFVTGYDSSAERSAAGSPLVSAPILSKPYRLDTLGLTVRQLLDS